METMSTLQSPSNLETLSPMSHRKSSLESIRRINPSNLLHMGEGVETVMSTNASPDVVPLGACYNNSGPFLPDSISNTPRQLAANPISALSKAYVQLLRKHQMAHCERNQVLFRLDSMSHENVTGFAKATVDILEAFLDSCDEASEATNTKPINSPSIMNHTQTNDNSVHNQQNMLQAVKSPALSRVSSRGSRSSALASPQTTPHHLPNWRQNNRIVSGEIPFASFASFMTTGSTRSMDDRVPIHETHHLQKSQDDEGNKTINRYSVLADLGKGAFGKVKLGVNNETDETVAIKIIKKSILKKSSDPLALNREIAILKKVRHQNVVSLYEVIDDPDSDKLYLVMQYVANGPIVRVKSDFTCTPIPEKTVKSYLKQLISGVRYLHERHIVHHDIKPDNILLGADGTVFITDFGVSEVFSAEQSLTESTRRGVGTPIFSAPELLIGQRSSLSLSDDGEEEAPAPRERSGSGTFDGVASDTWALGVTAFLMLVGRVPFCGRDYMEVVDAIQNHPVEWTGSNTSGQTLSPLWKEVLFGMLEKDPKKRWTLKRVKRHAVFHDEPEPEILGDMRKSSKPGVQVTTAEVAHATRKVCGFINEDAPAKVFTRSASTLVHSYVSNLRSRVLHRRVCPPLDGDVEDNPVPKISAGEEGDNHHDHHGSSSSFDVPMTRQHTSVPLVASPPRDSAVSSNPRWLTNHTSPNAHHLPNIEMEEPTPRFDDVFSVRRPTVAGEVPVRSRRRCSFPDGEDDTVTPDNAEKTQKDGDDDQGGGDAHTR